MSRKPPDSLVVMGRIVAPYGIKGWIKVQPFTETPHGLVDYATWQVGGEEAWQERIVESAKPHGAAVVAKLSGIDDREAAAALQGQRIAVSREGFPAPAAGEYYWADLIGLRVVNAAGEQLGTVSRLFETGANDVMVVDGDRERLLPFIGPVIRQVDLGGGVILVDWDADY